MEKSNLARSVADINTLNDIVFNFIFGSEDRKAYTISFLNSVLENDLHSPIIDLSIIDRIHPEYLDEESPMGFDASCRLENNKTVFVGVQIVNQQDAVNRMLFYWSLKYARTLGFAESYSQHKPVYMVPILTFPLHKYSSPHTRSIICNNVDKKPETDRFAIHWIEVPKLDVHQDLSQKSQLDRWVAFFANQKMSESERDKLMIDMTINQAYSEIDRFFAGDDSSP